MKKYRNRDTGEVLNYDEMLKQWAEEYDGGDDTNALDWAEQYEAVRLCPECGKLYTDAPAISRKDNTSEICPECGTKEALEAFTASKKRLELGRLVQTRGIYNACEESIDFSKEIAVAFNRYTRGDWGEMCDADKALNDEAVRTGGDRVLAAYETSKGKVYIITEYDRSATTILFANEY